MKVRVLHCLETIGSGGVEQRRLLMAKHLDSARYEQHVVCSYVINEFNLRFEEQGVPVSAIRGLHNLFNFPYYFRLFKVIRQYKPHIIHGAVFEGVISAVVGGLFCRVPVIIIEETSDPQNRSWRGTFLMKIFSILADNIVGISPSVVGYLRDKVHIKKSKLRLINNGVSVPVLPASHELQNLKKALGISESDFVIGSIGRLLDSHKRFSDVIKAVAILVKTLSDIKLVIVGDGKDKDMLIRMVHDVGLQNNVVFAGHQKDTRSYYAIMDVFCLASHMEGFGLVVVEAMFFKLPVVVTAVGGMKNIVLDGQTGLLVEKYSPESLAAAIKLLHDNPDMRGKMGMNGYQRAMDEYSAEVYVRKVDTLYKEACLKTRIS
jgi:glycosyltransferase involved in cell wall biosynthesis